MNGIPAGKLPVELLARLLATLGAAPADVRLGPAVGEDACVLRCPAVRSSQQPTPSR